MSVRSALVLAAALVVAGCASAPEVSITRTASTGISRDTDVAVMLLFHKSCLEHRDRTGGNCAPSTVTAQMNDEMAACLKNALEGTPRRVGVMPGHVFHARFLAADQADYERLTRPGTLALLKQPELQGALLAADIGFVVLMQVETREFGRHTIIEGGSGGGWGIGRTSRRETDVVATVWSVAQAVEAGVLRQKAVGESGWMVPMVVVVPLPPILYSSATESTACRVMGSALTEFLYSEAKPLN
jgi:hypothetical protein